MKLIKRNYLQELIEVMGTPDIKVITGVRRSGKSKLLEMFKKYINENVENANIININFNLVKFDNLREYHALNDYIRRCFMQSSKSNFSKIIKRYKKKLVKTSFFWSRWVAW